MDTLPRGVPEWAMTALVVVLVFYGVFPNGNLPPPAASLSSIDSSRRGDAAAAAAAAATIHHIGSPVPLINGPASKSSHDVIADIKARRHHEEAVRRNQSVAAHALIRNMEKCHPNGRVFNAGDPRRLLKDAAIHGVTTINIGQQVVDANDPSGTAFCQCTRGYTAQGPGALTGFDFGKLPAQRGWSLFPGDCGTKCSCVKADEPDPGAERVADAAAASKLAVMTMGAAGSYAERYECLTTAHPALEGRLIYPTDAEAHFEEVHTQLKNWTTNVKMHYAAGFRGPWIENRWIGMRPEKGKLERQFGGYIPIFVPWTDLWCGAWYRYPGDFVEALRKVLRKDVPYVTVNQNDDGVFGRCTESLSEEIPNLLVLSAGGVGHVPVPLLKGPLPASNDIPMAKRKYFAAFVGTLGNAPDRLRERMAAAVNSTGLPNRLGKFGDWKEIMRDTKLQLVPRGFGRTSYHLIETLQMGLIPIHIFSDIPWVPYGDLLAKHVFVTSIEGLAAVIDTAKALSDNELATREAAITSLRKSHFEWDGIRDQITRFLMGGVAASDLRCGTFKPNKQKESQERLRQIDKC